MIGGYLCFEGLPAGMAVFINILYMKKYACYDSRKGEDAGRLPALSFSPRSDARMIR